MPVEEKLGLTRELLEIALSHRFSVEVVTKSTRVVRDLDLLKDIDETAILPKDLKGRLEQGVIISFSLSTVDERLARILEPRAPSPLERLETMKQCKKAGLLVGVCAILVMPFLSDTDEELEKTVHAAKEYGADFIFVGGLTLFGTGSTDCKTRYFRFLEQYYPELLPKYKNLYRKSSLPTGTYQNELYRRAKKLCKKYSIRDRIV